MFVVSQREFFVCITLRVSYRDEYQGKIYELNCQLEVLYSDRGVLQ
jgi:hypothetical protein